LHDHFVSEVELAAEFDQAPAHNLYGLQPLVAVPSRQIEDRARVEQVVDVDIPAHLDLPQLEQPAETEVQLPEPIFKDGVGWD
jgi:hypothetical protein